jgi:hypothetical protein
MQQGSRKISKKNMPRNVMMCSALARIPDHQDQKQTKPALLLVSIV